MFIFCWCQYQSPNTMMTFVRFLNTVIIGTFRYLKLMNEVSSIRTKHTFTGSHIAAVAISKLLYCTTLKARQLSPKITASMHWNSTSMIGSCTGKDAASALFDRTIAIEHVEYVKQLRVFSLVDFDEDM